MTERLHTAEAFLQEAVFRSRAKQAAITGLAGQAGKVERGDIGRCGLGEKAVIELDLTPKGVELASELWRAALDATELARVREVTSAWIRAQDAFDRDRNHFLKAFRNQHGFDRRAWSAEQLRAYDAGLEAINERANLARREHAERMLGGPS